MKTRVSPRSWTWVLAVLAVGLTLWAIQDTGVAEDDSASSASPGGGAKAAGEAPESAEKDNPVQKRLDAHRLIVVSGGKERVQASMRHMMKLMQQQNPHMVTEEFIDEFLQQADVNELFEQLVPVYTKHLTHAEIKGLIEFYQTPLGKALLEKMPVVQKEAMTIAARWGAEIGQKAVEAIRQRRQAEQEE